MIDTSCKILLPPDPRSPLLNLLPNTSTSLGEYVLPVLSRLTGLRLKAGYTTEVPFLRVLKTHGCIPLDPNDTVEPGTLLISEGRTTIKALGGTCRFIVLFPEGST